VGAGSGVLEREREDYCSSGHLPLDAKKPRKKLSDRKGGFEIWRRMTWGLARVRSIQQKGVCVLFPGTAHWGGVRQGKPSIGEPGPDGKKGSEEGKKVSPGGIKTVRKEGVDGGRKNGRRPLGRDPGK